MNDIIDKVYDEARSAWRFRWIGMVLAVVVAGLGWVVVFTLPDRFEANASVFVDSRTALKPVLQGVTVEQDVNVQLNYVRQSLLSGDRLERIARDSGVLDGDQSDARKVATTLAAFSKRIILEVRSAGGGRESERETAGAVYSFKYQDGNRARSLRVTETLLKAFVEQTLGGRRAGTQNAQKFLETQIKTYEERLRVAENRLADFKKANLGLMPTEQGGYFAQLQNESDLAKKLENELNVAASRRAELARQLRGDAVVGATTGPAMVGGTLAGGGDTVSRIKEAQAKLDELLLRFTEKHPDVLAARATLKELQSRRAEEVASLRRGDASAIASSGVSTNPVYQSIQLQLNQADVDIASLRNQVAQHRAKATELRQRLDVAPRVEAEFAQLNRDYDINKAQYTTLLSTYEKAQLGERADDAGSVRFEIVQPPTAPFGPVSPQRTLLLAGVLMGALAAGGGVAFLLHLLSPVVASVRGLMDLSEMPVLGVVSAAFPREHAARARGDLIRFLGAGSVLVAAFVLVLILNRMGMRLNTLGVG